MPLHVAEPSLRFKRFLLRENINHNYVSSKGFPSSADGEIRFGIEPCPSDDGKVVQTLQSVAMSNSVVNGNSHIALTSLTLPTSPMYQTDSLSIYVLYYIKTPPVARGAVG